MIDHIKCEIDAERHKLIDKCPRQMAEIASVVVECHSKSTRDFNCMKNNAHNESHKYTSIILSSTSLFPHTYVHFRFKINKIKKPKIIKKKHKIYNNTEPNIVQYCKKKKS